MTSLLMILTALLAGLLLDDIGAAILGALSGYLLAAQIKLRQRIQRLERLAGGQSATPLEPASDGTHEPSPPAAEPWAPGDRTGPPGTFDHATVDAGNAWNTGETGEAVAQPGDRPEGTRPERGGRAPLDFVKAWITGGNMVVRVGIIVLFFGVAFLLKYAAENSALPMQLRLTGVAAGGLALLVLGWRLRLRRTAYAVALEGGGIGVLYLTVFSALRLYDLLPVTAAFAMLSVLAVLSALIAVRQNALSLAILGVTGGFLAPVLASTGAGSHVALFSYYLVLNLSILAIAWYRSWRLLNLIGFSFTFVIASVWGYRYYQPEFFASTEPFLIAYVLLYVSVSVLFAARQPPRLKGYVDGTLVFGTPLIGFALQQQLLAGAGHPLSWSAIAASAFYLALARVLYRRSGSDTGQGLRLLSEAFLANGIVFATLAIPLAMDASWTAGMWALEGTALIWVGLRQQRRLPRIFAYLLQAGAGYQFIEHLQTSADGMAVFNSTFIGATIVAAAGLLSAWLLFKHRQHLHTSEEGAEALLFVWGGGWWLAAGLHEIDRYLGGDYYWGGLLGFLAGSAALARYPAPRLQWPLLRYPALGLLPALLAVALDMPHPSAQFGLPGWLAAIGVYYWALKYFDDADQKLHELLHAVPVWLIVILTAWELSWLIDRQVAGGAVWTLIVWGLVPAAALFWLLRRGQSLAWPIRTWYGLYLQPAALPLVLAMIAWLFLISGSDGNPVPLGYLPILNPADISSGLVLLVLSAYYRHPGTLTGRYRAWETPLSALLVIGGFICLNAVLARALHHWAAIPFDLPALFHSGLAQTSASIMWSLTGLTAMILAVRSQRRQLWLAGAGLMAAVVAKLFLIDLSGSGTVERIVSFIGVGVLLLVVGYFAPAPGERSPADRPV